MKFTITQDKAFKIIEWILFIGFSIVAGLFASGVIQHFFSQKTSFSQLEEKITEYPVVIIAPVAHSDVNLNNFKIMYWANGMKYQPSLWKLELGENNFYNYIHNTTEKVILQSIENSNGKRAFRITHATPIRKLQKDRPGVMIKIYANFKKNPEDLFSDLVSFILSSRKNSLGFFDNAWNDGNPLKITLDKNSCVIYNIQPQITKYLKELGKCEHESYYECFSSQIDGTEFNKCLKKCIPNIFLNMGKNYSTPFCQNDTYDQQCMAKEILEKDLGSKCKKSCSTLEYYGEIETSIPYHESKDEIWNIYWIFYRLTNNNFAAKVYEEYFIYDAIGMIGSVGGTLGKLILIFSLSFY